MIKIQPASMVREKRKQRKAKDKLKVHSIKNKRIS